MVKYTNYRCISTEISTNGILQNAIACLPQSKTAIRRYVTSDTKVESFALKGVTCHAFP